MAAPLHLMAAPIQWIAAPLHWMAITLCWMAAPLPCTSALNGRTSELNGRTSALHCRTSEFHALHCIRKGRGRICCCWINLPAELRWISKNLALGPKARPLGLKTGFYLLTLALLTGLSQTLPNPPTLCQDPVYFCYLMLFCNWWGGQSVKCSVGGWAMWHFWNWDLLRQIRKAPYKSYV